MQKLIKVIAVHENRVDMLVCAARITFALKDGKATIAQRTPSARECYVPTNILFEAQAQARAILLAQKERAAIET